uniref:RGS domain-containing protein n=1 Tax=Sphaeramia orbicularis TaxID=375764 RepID=A0A672Y734_9TELE
MLFKSIVLFFFVDSYCTLFLFSFIVKSLLSLQEKTLVSDDLLAHYFNDFLSLPCFPEVLLYNQETGLFEVESGAAEFVSRKIRLGLNHSKSRLLMGDPMELARTPPVDNRYTVRCLDRERGIQWVMKERLHFFLQSDYYYEYRTSGDPHTNPIWISEYENQLIKTNTYGRLECKVYQDSAAEDRDEVQGKKEKVQEGNRVRTATEKAEWEKTDGRTQQENGPGVCCHDICCHGNRSGLDEFKAFLQGTPGDKLLNLWMDIERLKTTQNRDYGISMRYLGLMRSRYLQSSSQSCLHVELLSRLGLNTSPCWTEEKLQSNPPHCSDTGTNTQLVLYYQVLFVHVKLGLNHICICNCCLIGVCFHQFYSSRFQLLGSRRMEQMIQALCSDSCSGLYFTHFCEQSGNQLWEDAVYFWTDLQHYHELFYQDGLDPYRVQREAQLLYSTFLSSSARRSIGVDEEIRREVYNRLVPAFEELFDEAEDHSLNILLEPWTLLINGDKESFQQVNTPLVGLTTPINTCACFNKKQYSALLFPPVPPSTLFSKGPLASGSWSNVSSPYQGYRLGSLLRHRHEIGHFMAFLQNQDAGLYRRTPQRDKSVRQERSTHISTKYLNRNYFFGPDSPASIEQQNDRLKLQCLSNPVVMEIQDVVRTHIEETWLPQFLSTEEFIEREKKSHDWTVEFLTSCKNVVYHVSPQTNGLWMSSSKEILLFRRILLNPVTCLQFQYFVSLKGDFLENDLLFWLEVQRYKDLCHSHSDEATIQRKISTIISCFINSSMPPSLQIDIPPEQAQHILENRHKLGPYIFREAQICLHCCLDEKLLKRTAFYFLLTFKFIYFKDKMTKKQTQRKLPCKYIQSSILLKVTQFNMATIL